MQVKRTETTPTKTKLEITADQGLLDKLKEVVVASLGQNVKVQGFRPGKAPSGLIEKQLDANNLQAAFLEEAINRCYVEAIQHEKLRPVAQPNINVTKFVPFITLEFVAEVDVVGKVELPDYTKIKLAKIPVTVLSSDVDEVITNLRARSAAKKPVTRASKVGDEVVIDFVGVDAKTKEPINGAEGKAYPLVLGSQAFIPGFEDEVIGLKANDTKDFSLAFPKDYGVATLRNRQVTFTVTATSVNELEEPKLDDAWAATVGPFKTLVELKADIKKQLKAEKDAQASGAYENELLTLIAEKSTVAIPEVLIEEEINRLEEEEKRNIAYRGQTWQEHLDEEGVDEAGHREKKREAAEARVKAGLILADIAEKEQIEITNEELDMRLQQLKAQYQDQGMQAELDKPEARREIASRLVSEKTIAKLVSYAGVK